MDLKSKPIYNTEAVEQKALDRITVYCTPKDFDPNSTAFHMGYEQAKRDILRIITAELKK
jgi:hypothetical protein